MLQLLPVYRVLVFLIFKFTPAPDEWIQLLDKSKTNSTSMVIKDTSKHLKIFREKNEKSSCFYFLPMFYNNFQLFLELIKLTWSSSRKQFHKILTSNEYLLFIIDLDSVNNVQFWKAILIFAVLVILHLTVL